MTHPSLALFSTVALASCLSLAAATDLPLSSPDLVHQETDGLVVVEAEHFIRQENAEVRAWHLFTGDDTPDLQPDADPSHVAGASGGAYLEALPDSRRNHSEKLIKGENFSNEPGKMAILTYRVHFNTPGKYHVWVRTHSTGTEDNGIHVGLNGTWPESGQRMQWTAKHRWAWGSKQRTEEQHGGVHGLIFLEIEEPGEHEIQFSMREDGFEFDQWLMTTDAEWMAPLGAIQVSSARTGALPDPFTPVPMADTSLANSPSPEAKSNPDNQPPSFDGNLFGDRGEDGDGTATVSGELKKWHKVTLTLNGPFAHEKDNAPNPFTDLNFRTTFTHSSGASHTVLGYFAADGNASESSAESGNQWRVHLAPGLTGEWSYQTHFTSGKHAALFADADQTAVAPFDGVTGSFVIEDSDKTGRDHRAHGRLNYVGKHHLEFSETGRPFLKAGADAPETFLGYADFDGTVAAKPEKCPLKTWEPHLQDWNEGDPTWKGGKGKGMIGAINYLSGKGCNVFSFLTYNAGGDGDNVWPFIERNDKFNYDCSKLDQWGIVFDHATAKGMYLHFKLQETENDDLIRGGHKDANRGIVPAALDGGELGPERKLYFREIVARYGHQLALNWNLGEENTQSIPVIKEMADYIGSIDPYDHLIVIHTYPNQHDKIYGPLLGGVCALNGASIQNSNIRDTHWQIVKWTRASAEAGVPWVVSLDEPGSASEGMPADPGYPGMPENFDNPSVDDTRKYVLWGTLLGGGGGVEYYFGYKLPENDLLCEDWRSRDLSWTYCGIALDFFREEEIPVNEMSSLDELVGNPEHDNSAYCFAKEGELYLVFLPNGGSRDLDLSAADGDFTLQWFNPRDGNFHEEEVTVSGGGTLTLTAPGKEEDWLGVLSR
ncbi:MAG: DUF5060 domain-containing protein [Verrucomicrobiota bacterium]